MKRLSILLLAMTSVPVFANQLCAPTVSVEGGQYVPPTGWYVTESKLAPSAKDVKLNFSAAAYNYDHKTGEKNGNRISCTYTSVDALSTIQITSQQVAKQPKEFDPATHWEPIFKGGDVCTWGAIAPSDCPWDFN